VGERATVRFGVRRGDLRSQYWSIHCSARGDVYIASEKTGRFLHVSAHYSADHWRIVWIRPDGTEQVDDGAPPAERIPGTRVLAKILIPTSTVTDPVPKKQVVWVPTPTHDDMWTVFSILVSDPPGPAIRGAVPLGSYTLPDGRIVSLVAQHGPALLGSVRFSPVGGDIDEARRQTEAGTAAALMVGRDERGTLLLLDLRPERVADT
jgi:hypothetical protein